MRERARRTARAALFDHALGAAPETALRATDAADARLKMLGVPCACGATIEDRGEWTECRYDGRRMSVVVRSCGVCRRPQSLYVDVAPEIAPTA
jgi:hypothetical protein